MFNNLAENMGARTPESFTAFLAVKCEKLKRTITFQWPIHVPQNIVDRTNQRWISRILPCDVHWNGLPSLPFFHLFHVVTIFKCNSKLYTDRFLFNNTKSELKSLAKQTKGTVVILHMKNYKHRFAYIHTR